MWKNNFESKTKSAQVYQLIGVYFILALLKAVYLQEYKFVWRSAIFNFVFSFVMARRVFSFVMARRVFISMKMQ